MEVPAPRPVSRLLYEEIRLSREINAKLMQTTRGSRKDGAQKVLFAGRWSVGLSPWLRH